MSFFLGLVEGAAKSVDRQLQSDMQRTQERIDGMAQYRITRRRAELERKEKDKKELRSVLDQLASYTDGNEDKAIQLYNSAGKTIAGANDLLSELRTNQKAGVNVRSALKFAEDNAEPGNFTDFIKRNVTPVSSLPLIEGEMKASGLAGMFGRDIGKEVMQQVGEAAPISEEAIPEGMGRTAQATIDRSEFLAATEQAERVAERKRSAREFEMKEEEFDLTMDAGALKNKELKQAMKLAEQSAKLAQDKFASAEDQRAFENARKKVADLQTEARLIMEAEEFVKDMELKSLSIDEQKDAAKKRKEHPVFSSFEDMAVYATQKLAAGGLSPEDEEMFEKMRNEAFDNAKKYNEKTTAKGGDAVKFGSINRDSFINAEIKRRLEPVGMIDELGQQISAEIEGNYPVYFDRMTQALISLTNTTDGLGDVTMSKMIAEQKKALVAQKDSYKAGVSDTQRKDAGDYDNFKSSSFKSQLKAGDVVTYKNDNGDTVTRIWTGDRYV
tara:strand:- start:128 stop:1624 length:1497 start_codon:yes stop_codon:yes gene_type:complete